MALARPANLCESSILPLATCNSTRRLRRNRSDIGMAMVDWKYECVSGYQMQTSANLDWPVVAVRERACAASFGSCRSDRRSARDVVLDVCRAASRIGGLVRRERSEAAIRVHTS